MRIIEIDTNDGAPIQLTPANIVPLRSHLSGQLLTPSDADYDEARRLWNGMIDRYPSLIVRCATPEDVVKAVSFAKQGDLRLSVRGGGHNVAGTALVERGIVIDLTPMKHVSVDPEQRTAWVEAGATLGDVDRATQQFGLAVPVGVVSETGIAGLTLHGGFGWLSRRFGMTVDNLRAVDIVTADGKLRRADAERHRDLFWAVRGGGGNFGVVTGFEFQAHEVGPEVWLTAAVYPASERKQVLAGHRDFMATAPEEFNSLCVLWSAPDLDAVPRESRGKPAVIVVGCYTGPVDEGAEQIQPLKELGTLLADLGGRRSWLDAQTFFDPDYPDGLLYYWKSVYLDRLDDEVFDRLIDLHDRRPSPLNSLDVWIFGGAVNCVDPTATAFAQREARFMLGIEANWTDRDDSDANVEWAREVHREMQAFSAGGGLYLNFPGFAEEQHLVEDVYAQNFAKLARVKAKYDAGNLFRGNFNIRPEV